MILKVYFNTDLLAPAEHTLFEHERSRGATEVSAFLFTLRKVLQSGNSGLDRMGFAGGTVATTDVDGEHAK